MHIYLNLLIRSYICATGKFVLTIHYGVSVCQNIKVKVNIDIYTWLHQQTMHFIMDDRSTCHALMRIPSQSHATARGSIPGGKGVKTELHVLRKGQ